VDIFAPPDQAKHPAVLVLHGSAGITRIDRFHGIARYFAEQGYVALFPHYLDVTGQTSLSQSDIDHVVVFTARTKSGSFEARFDLWKRSIGDAISFAGKQPNVDKQRIAIVGFSLGSFLSLDILPGDDRVGALAEFYGAMSPIKSAGVARMPPVLILHGEQDDLVPVSRAYDLEKVMQRLKTPYEMKIYPGEEHGFSPEAQRDALDRAIAFFDKHLQQEKPETNRDRLQ
jgi:carboxymethylenebutenolidase